MTRPAADSVKTEWTGTGTGTISLGSVVTGFQGFPAALDGAVISYSIEHQAAAERENGIGTYTATGDTLSRDLVTFSTNGDALVDFSSGTKHVKLTALALDIIEHRDTVDPGTGDDIDSGFIAGRSRWLNTSSGELFFCTDHTVGAAVWQQVGSGGGSGGVDSWTSVEDSGDYSGTAFAVADANGYERRRFTTDAAHQIEFPDGLTVNTAWTFIFDGASNAVLKPASGAAVTLNGAQNDISIVGTVHCWVQDTNTVLIIGETGEPLELDASLIGNGQVIRDFLGRKDSGTSGATLDTTTVQRGSYYVHTGGAATLTIPDRGITTAMLLVIDSFLIVNNGTGNLSLQAGTGVTLQGDTTISPDNEATVIVWTDGSSILARARSTG